MPSILTIPATARLIGVSRKTLWAWVSSLPEWQSCVAHRVGRRVYLSTARLRAAGHLENP